MYKDLRNTGKVSDSNKISVSTIDGKEWRLLEPQVLQFQSNQYYSYEYGMMKWKPGTEWAEMWRPRKVCLLNGFELNLTSIVSSVARTVVYFFGATGFETMCELFGGLIAPEYLQAFFDYYCNTNRPTSPIPEIENYLKYIGYIAEI